MQKTEYVRFRLLSIDAWRDPDGGWFWNQWHKLEDGIYIAADRIRPRPLLAFMRRAGWLTDYSKGRVYIDELPTDRYHLTICHRGTHEPLLCLEECEAPT